MADSIQVTILDGDIVADGDIILTSTMLQEHADIAPHQEHMTLLRTIIESIMREHVKPATLIIRIFKHISAHQRIVNSMTGVGTHPMTNNLQPLYDFVRKFHESLLLRYDRPAFEPATVENQLALQELINATEESITLTGFQHAGLSIDVSANTFLLDAQLPGEAQLSNGKQLTRVQAVDAVKEACRIHPDYQNDFLAIQHPVAVYGLTLFKVTTRRMLQEDLRNVFPHVPDNVIEEWNSA